MNILIDLNHPAHYHYCKNFIKQSVALGHSVKVIARKRFPTQELLESDKIPYVDRGVGGKGLLGKLFYFFVGDWYVFKEAIKFKPDIFLAFMSPYAPQVGWLLRKPVYLFDDTEHAKLHKITTYPFCTKIFSPNSFRGSLGKKQEKFNGFMELAYLHPDVFQPDPTVLEELEVEPEDKFVIFRFVSWEAHHDVGHSGMSLENKIKAVTELSKYAKVLITSEQELPSELKAYQVKIAPHRMHHALYYASLLLGESATMASEAAMLGTPAIFMDNDGRGYTDELENKYGLVANYTESENDQIMAIGKAVEMIQEDAVVYSSKRNKLLDENINLTRYMIENLLS